jgi:hypothetical protein
MSELPRTFEETAAQMGEAIRRARDLRKSRLQLDVRVPGLDVLNLLVAVAPSFGEGWVALFPDPGAAALARKRLGEVSYAVRGLSEMRRGVEGYRAYVLIEPSAVEVETVEAIASQAGEKPFVILNSRLEEAGAVGIGLSGRRLRERFLSTLDVIYAIQPFEGGALYRCYPGKWQLWREESDGEYTLLSEFDRRPLGEDIDTAMRPASAGGGGEGLLAGLRRFLRALGN